jgi:nucleoside-diphosphate-sugar epimerase
MKIFLTGGTGFIGSNLARHWNTHAVDHYRRHMSDLQARLDWFAPDWIVNCAAEIYNKEQMWRANVEITRDCLEWMRKNPRTRMIQLGSSSEYGPVDRPSKESDPMRATDMYGTTKGIATMLCQTYARTYDLDVVVVRPYSPYGPGEREHRLFPRLWQAFMLDRPMDLVQGVHDFCYISDFIRAIDIIMTSDHRRPGDIINVSSGVQTTNAEVLSTFQRITGQGGNVIMIDRWVTPSVWQADITHAQEHYGWRPEITLEQGIREFLSQAHYE